MAYSYEHNPTNPDAFPVYNNSILNIFRWFADSWSCSDWVVWHKANVIKYGIEKANDKFRSEWSQLALVTTTADCKTWNTSFRDYMKKVGLLDEMGNIISNVIGSANDAVHNISSGLSSASKVLKIAIPLIMVVIIVIGVMYATKYAKKSAK